MLATLSLRRLLAVALAAVFAAVLLPYAASQAVPAKDPAVGDCHDYTFDQGAGLHDASPIINCNQDHTARVIAVKSLPDGKNWSDYTKNQQIALAVRKCLPETSRALGSTYKRQDRTAYMGFFFLPTKAQQADGARWIRCDLDLLAGRTLLNLPTDDEPALPSGSLPDSIARCLTGRGYTTTCERSHAYRSVGAFTMHVKTYPGPKKAERLAVRHCGRFVTTRSWWYTFRARPSFRQGDHVMVCYNKSKH